MRTATTHFSEFVCPLCGFSQSESYFDDDNRLLRCLSCNTGFLAPNLWIRDLEAYYVSNPAYAENSLNEQKVLVMKRAAKNLLSIIAKYAPPTNGKILLDIGSNYGAFLDCAKEAGYTARGIEMNKELAQKAVERGLQVVHGDAMTVSGTAVFDVITMIHVLEHIPEVKVLLKKIHSALKENGYFFVEVHNVDSYIARKHKSSWKYVSLEHLYYFTPQTLVRLMEDQGFTVVKVVSRNHYLETFSIKYLLQYLYATPRHNNRFFKKGDLQSQAMSSKNKKERSIFLNIVHTILIFIITILKREDLMLIIARKDSKK